MNGCTVASGEQTTVGRPAATPSAALAAFDHAAICRSAAAEWERRLGVARGDAPGRALGELLGGAGALDETVRAALAGEPREQRHSAVGADGTRRELRLRFLPFATGDAVPGFLVLADDDAPPLAAPERRDDVEAAAGERMSELQRALAEAERARTLALLSSGIAHDFNNVLAAISGCLHILGRVAQEPVARECIERGHRGIDRAGRLVQQLLALGATTDGEARAVPVRRAVDAMLGLLRVAAGPSVEVQLSGDSRWAACVDPQRLEVALLNLAINARDAMPRGGRLRIGVHDAPAGRGVGGVPVAADHVVVALTDDGTGMTPEVLARARQPFFTTKPADRGTGLGLMMVDGFVREAGGRLLLESRPGRGTTATLLLPRAAGEAVAAEPPPQPAVDALAHGGARLLLVDADPLVRPVVARMLQNLGYEVHEAATAGQAWSIVAGGDRPDLLVADLGLPGRGGAALAADVQALHAGLPILLTSAGGVAVEDAPAPVLRKPFTEAALACAVAGVLGRLPRDAGRMLARLREDALRALYVEWSHRRTPHRLPAADELALEAAGCPLDNVFVAEVTSLAPFRFGWLFLGGTLQRALGGLLDGHGSALGGSFELGELERAYRRCIRRREASHEYLRLRTSRSGEPLVFERLLVPCTDAGGLANRIVGAAIFRNLPTRDDEHAS